MPQRMSCVEMVATAWLAFASAGTFVTAQSELSSVRIAPWAQIQHVVNAHPAGTTYLLEAGYHREQTIQPKSGDVFIGEPGAILSGAKLLTGWVRDGADWKVTGQMQGRAPHGGEWCLPAYPRCGNPEDLWMNGVLKRHVQHRAALVPGAWYFDYATDTIYVRDNPTASMVETSVSANAFRGTAMGVTIRGLVIERYANVAQAGALDSSEGRDWKIEDTEIRYNHGTGLRIGDRLQVRRTRIYDNYQLGVGGTGRDVVVEGTEIARNNLQFNPEWEGGGSKFSATANLIVRANWVHHNRGPGLWTDINNVGTLYEGNISEANAVGIFHEISYAAIIRHNAVRGNGTWTDLVWTSGAGILVAASPNVEIYGNALDCNAVGVIAMQQDRGSGIYGPYSVENLSVHDNVVRHCGAGVIAGLIQDVNDNTYFNSRNNRFERNTYASSNGCNRFAWSNSDTNSFPAWMAYGHDRATAFCDRDVTSVEPEFSIGFGELKRLAPTN